MIAHRHVSIGAAWLAGLAALLVLADATAELIVIYDSGDAKPLAPLLGPVQSARRADNRKHEAGPSLGAADLDAILPIASPGLTPGIVSSRTYTQRFVKPFFLVGSDARSRQWLHRHRATLKQVDAMGMLVEAESVEDVHAILAIADGLPLLPASGTDIAQALGIEHYPVAVTEGRLWQ